MEPNWLEEIYRELNKTPVDILSFGHKTIYRDRVEKHPGEEKVSLEQAKGKSLSGEWTVNMWAKCFKRSLFQGIRFPVELLCAQDRWLVGELMVKASSIGFISECLYNYDFTNQWSITHNYNRYNWYCIAVTYFHNNQLLKREGLPCKDLSDMNVLKFTVAALTATNAHGKLTTEQITQLEEILERFKESVAEMDLLSKYKAYHALAKYAKAQSNYRQAFDYYCRYVGNKLKYLL